MNNLTTLNPKVCMFVLIMTLLGIDSEPNSIFTFFLGFLVTLPLIIQVWRTMKDNWSVYRKFYSMPFHRRDMKTIRKSWKLTWWVFPYTVIVYSVMDLFVLFNPALGSPLGMLYGSLFAVFGYTLLQSNYYFDLVKRKK